MPPEHRMSVLMVGTSGAGKSEAPRQIVGDLFVTLNLNEEYKEAFTGINYATPGVDHVTLLLQTKAKELFDMAEANPADDVMFQLEEFLQGDSEMQKAAAAVLNDRILVGRKLPENVIVVANGNPMGSNCGANKSMAHVINRCAVFHIKTVPMDGIKWMISQRLNEKVIAYLSAKPSAMFLSSDPDGGKDDEMLKLQLKRAANECKQMPTARSWTKFAYCLDAIEKSKRNTSDEELILFASSIIGEERAHDFVALMNCDIPDRMALLNGTADWPSNPYEEYSCIIREAKLTDMGTSEAVAKLLARVDPEMVSVYLDLLRTRLVNEGNIVNPMKVMTTWPGFKYLIGDESRYGAVLGA